MCCDGWGTECSRRRMALEFFLVCCIEMNGFICYVDVELYWSGSLGKSVILVFVVLLWIGTERFRTLLHFTIRLPSHTNHSVASREFLLNKHVAKTNQQSKSMVLSIPRGYQRYCRISVVLSRRSVAGKFLARRLCNDEKQSEIFQRKREARKNGSGCSFIHWT